MKMARRRFSLAALLLLCGGIIIAAVALLPAAQLGDSPVPAISTNMYLSLMACRCANLDALAQLLDDAQYDYLPMLPPDPDIGFTAHGTLTPFNFTNLPAGFNLQLLAGKQVNGVTVFPLTIAQDPESRETVFLNSQGDVLYSLPPPAGYDPVAWLLAWRTNLAPSLARAASTNAWLQMWDPARIQLSLKLIALDDVVPYLQAAALAQSCRLGQQSLAVQQNGLTPMLLTSSAPCAITNETDPFAVLSIQADTNGWMTLTWESCTGRVYAVEARADLLDSIGWLPLASNVGEIGSTAWTDFDASSYPQRFYRVQRQPLNYCSVSNCVLTNFDIEVPDWWKLQHGFPVSTPADAICANGLTINQNFNFHADPNQPVMAPASTTITGQFVRAVLGKCGFDEYTTNPVNVYLRRDQVGQQDNCGGLTNYTCTIIHHPTPTNCTAETNESMAIEYDVNVFLTNSATELVASNSNPAVEDNFTNTLSELYTTESLTNLTMAALSNGTWTAVTDPSQCAAIRALTPDGKTNTLQQLAYGITFQSQAGVAYEVQWMEHTELTNGFSTNVFLTELVAGNGGTAATTNHILALPDICGTSTVVMAAALLLADTDRNGVINDFDHYGKMQWTLARGALVPPREIVAGSNSIAGLSKIVIRPPGTNFPTGLSCRLKAVNGETEQYLKLLDVNGNKLGITNACYTLPVWPTTGQVFYVASAQTRNYFGDAPRRFVIDLEILQTNNKVIASDRVMLTVAPIILPPDCYPAQAVYSTHEIGVDGVTNLNCDAGTDYFAQDIVKFIKTQCATGIMADAFISLGHPAGSNMIEKLVASNETYGAYWGADGAGGNIMATPPLPDAPYGKILVGSDRIASVDLWSSQGIQPVVTNLDLTWLKVGHVDEVIMFVAANKVAFADPWTAADLLHGALTNGHGGDPIWFGVGASATGTAREVSILQVVVAKDTNTTFKTNSLFVGMSGSSNTTSIVLNVTNNFENGDVLRVDNELLEVQSVNGPTVSVIRALADRPAGVHSSNTILYAYSNLMKHNLPVDNSGLSVMKKIEAITNKLSQACGYISAAPFVPLPVIFDFITITNNNQIVRLYFAASANVVNCLPNWNGCLYYPDTGCAVLETDISAKLQIFNPVPRDVWDNYHCRFGEIHCGTAARRQIGLTPAWWENIITWEQ